jgi:hypothetical protein
MKAKLLSFRFFYFHFLFGIGTFQRVTPEKIKKIATSELASQVVRNTLTCSALSLMGSHDGAGAFHNPKISISRKYREDCGFSQDFVYCNWVAGVKHRTLSMT